MSLDKNALSQCPSLWANRLQIISAFFLTGESMNTPARMDLNLPALLAALLLSGVIEFDQVQANPGRDQDRGEDSLPIRGTPPAAAPDTMLMFAESPVASPLPESSRSTRPGRSGRDLGNRLQPQRQEPIRDQLAPQDPQNERQSLEPAAQPAARPPQERATDQPQSAPQHQAIDQEREQRRRQMELQQQQAEEVERLRREARYRQLMQQHQEALGTHESHGEKPKQAR